MPRTPLLLLLLTTALGCQPAAEAPDPFPALDFQPNILWLVAEDLGPYIPPFGDSTVATPNLSRLAAEGVRYTNVFSPSGVCAPSRAALATGMYPSSIAALHMRTGPWFAYNVPEDIVASYAQYMPEGLQAYEAMPPAGVKMHSERLREAGYYATNNSKEDYQFRRPMTAWDESSNDAHWRDRAPGQPFFAIFNFGVTHESRIWAKADDPMLVPEDQEVPIPPYLPDTEVGETDVRRMYSNIIEMDRQVGQVLDELAAGGQLDSTIVFWYTDHGGPLPRQKRLLYDSGLHVPMIVRFPGAARAGTADDRLISFIDFKPTLMSLAGIENTEPIHGQAFLGPATAPPRTYIHAAADRFDERYDIQRAVRDQRFKYIRNYRTDLSYYLPVSYREQMPIMQELLRLRDAGELTEAQAQWFRPEKAPHELFDTEADPHELNNLAQDPAYADKLAELSAEMDRWMAAINDQGLMPEPELLSTLWPGGTQPVTASPTVAWTGQTVQLASATEGASIGFQVLPQNQDPGDRWQVYTGPVTIGPGQKVVAIAQRIGYKPSEMQVFG